MTVWNDRDHLAQRIATPFTEANVNPASIDLTLAPEYIDLRTGERMVMPASGLNLWPGVAILACTAERIALPVTCAALVLLKSSAARKGLDHALAGWVDPGFDGDLTLELHAHRPVTITPGERLVQLAVFNLTDAPARPYSQTGRYHGQQGPTEARA